MHGQADELLGIGDLAERPDFRIGEALVSPSKRTVSGPGGETVIEPRVMQVLLALHDAQGRVVTRDALFRRCWGSVYVGEDSLNRAIAEVRRVARTVAPGGFTVETIPRTGYRLVSDEEATPAASLPPEPTAQKLRGALTRRLAIGGAGAAAAGGLGWWAWRPDPVEAQVEALIAQSEQAARSGLPDSDAQGVGFLQEAVALKPGNARAWGRLALARTTMAEFAPPDRAAGAVAGVQDAARRALALDPRQIDAHSALAILPPYHGDWFAAERRMRAVLRLDPEHLPTRDVLDFMLFGVGRCREASIDRIAMAARDPLHANYQFKLVYSHWLLGDIGAADRAAERALQLWPKHPGVWFARLYTLAFTGRGPRALAQVEDEAARPDLPPFMVETLRLAMTALVSGRPADRTRAAEAALAEVARGPSLSINGLVLLTGLGEIDRAFELANAYLLEQGPLMASVRWRRGQVSINDARRRKTHMLFVPSAAGMRADPRFMPLMERVGLVDYWRQARVLPDFLRKG